MNEYRMINGIKIRRQIEKAKTGILVESDGIRQVIIQRKEWCTFISVVFGLSRLIMIEKRAGCYMFEESFCYWSSIILEITEFLEMGR